MLAYFGNSFAICDHDDVVALEEADETKNSVGLRYLPYQPILLLLFGHELFHLFRI